jgi:hypothetical protein
MIRRLSAASQHYPNTLLSLDTSPRRARATRVDFAERGRYGEVGIARLVVPFSQHDWPRLFWRAFSFDGPHRDGGRPSREPKPQDPCCLRHGHHEPHAEREGAQQLEVAADRVNFLCPK